MTKIFLAIPSKTGSVFISTTDAIQRFRALAEQRGVGVVSGIIFNDPYVQEARNALANQFLDETDCTHLLFLDDDVVFAPEHVFRLIEAEKGVIAGIYSQKRIDFNLVARNAQRYSGAMLAHTSCPTLLILPPGTTKFTGADLRGPIEVVAAPTGFLSIERGILEKFRAHFPFRYRNSRYPGELTAFFQVGYREGNFCGEDVDFCLKVREMGEKIWAMPYLTLGHAGMHVHFGCAFCSVGEPIHAIEEPKTGGET